MLFYDIFSKEIVNLIDVVVRGVMDVIFVVFVVVVSLIVFFSLLYFINVVIVYFGSFVDIEDLFFDVSIFV